MEVRERDAAESQRPRWHPPWCVARVRQVVGDGGERVGVREERKREMTEHVVATNERGLLLTVER